MRLYLPSPTPSSRQKHFSNLLMGKQYGKKDKHDNGDSRLSTRSEVSNNFHAQTAYSLLRVFPQRQRPQTSLAYHPPSHKISYTPSFTRQEQLYRIFIFPLLTVTFVDKADQIILQSGTLPQIKTTTKPIFQTLIKNQLLGPFTFQFVQTIESYRPLLFQFVPNFSLLTEIQHISHKKQLLQKLIFFQHQNKTQHILSMLYFFCFNDKQTRNIKLNKWIQSLSTDFYQQKSVSKDLTHHFFLSSGKQIKDLIQFPLLTNELFLASSQEKFKNYSKMMQCHLNSRKNNFVEQIKQSFKKNNQIIIKNSNNREIITKQTKKNTLQQNYIFQSIIKNRERQSLKQKHKKIQEKCFLTKNFIREKLIVPIPIFEKQKQKQKFTSFLITLTDFLHSSLQKPSERHLAIIQRQFQTFYRMNNRYDLSYNYKNGNERKILLQVLQQHYPFFKNKNNIQFQLIKTAITKYLQIKCLQQITENHFISFHSIVIGVHSLKQCERFVCLYLNFDNNGQIKRQQFCNKIEVMINKSKRNANIIEKIIWTCFEKHQLIDLNCLKKQKFEEKTCENKLVIFLLLSVIFGDCICDHLLNIKPQ